LKRALGCRIIEAILGVDIAESARSTPVELADLVAEAVSWWRQQQREKFLPYGIPLSDAQQTQLKPFFTAELLDQVRIVKLSQTGESIPYPPFYEKFLATGSSIIPDPAHMTGMPFFDVAVSNVEPPPRAIFHTLVHIAQLALIGPERVLEAYLRTLNERGLWAVVPFEEQAYHLDARYTGNPADCFSVEEKVREWLRSGRYFI
jgi:hypothetical protein